MGNKAKERDRIYMREYRKNHPQWKEVIDNLEPFPENRKNFEIDHIIPLHSFNLTNPEEVKKAFSPSNLQWLTREENRKKSGKLVFTEEPYKNNLFINNGES